MSSGDKVLSGTGAATGTATLAGTATQYQTLQATSNLADADGATGAASTATSYQWQQSQDGITWQNIEGARFGGFTLTQAQVGHYVRTAASFTDALGAPEVVYSQATAARIANVNDTPIGAVVVTGSGSTVGGVKLGQVLTAHHALSDLDGMAGNNGTEYFPGWNCQNFEYSHSRCRRKRERDHSLPRPDPAQQNRPERYRPALRICSNSTSALLTSKVLGASRLSKRTTPSTTNML